MIEAMKRAQAVLTLQEYRTESLPAEALDQETGMLLWRRYDRELGVLEVNFPSPRSNGRWQLTPRGWVGLIRATPRLALALRPRMPVDDLFGMLDVAYGLKSFRFLSGIAFSDSLEGVYERLALALAQGVLRRARKGLYGAYVTRRERLPFVRGRMAVQPVGQSPAQAGVLCEFEEWRTDVPENQILAWTLWTVLQAGFCREAVQAQVRQALRALEGHVTLIPVRAEECTGRRYDRLNADYAPLHALCRFFLAHSGPGHKAGEEATPSFLVNMPRLYERYVAEILRQALPVPWTVRTQETVTMRGASEQAGDAVQFTIDLALYDGDGVARAVLDTKYRAQPRAAAGDVAQVAAYAQSKGCRRAVLIYPQPLSAELDIMVGDVRVQSLPICAGEHARRDTLALAQMLVGR